MTIDEPDRGWDEEVRTGETEAERLDRNFNDLISELRVSINGVQVLFAFLLILPFSSGFGRLGATERAVYFGTLMIAAFSTLALIAPAAMHRVLFRRHRKADLVRLAARLALTGLGLLSLAVAGGVWLVGDDLYGLGLAMAMSLLALVWSTVWFFVVPGRMVVRSAHRGGDPDRREFRMDDGPAG